MSKINVLKRTCFNKDTFSSLTDIDLIIANKHRIEAAIDTRFSEYISIQIYILDSGYNPDSFFPLRLKAEKFDKLWKYVNENGMEIPYEIDKSNKIHVKIENRDQYTKLKKLCKQMRKAH